MKDIIAVELLKLKNSKILWIVILPPAFMVMQGVINLLRYYDLFTGHGQNVWEQLYMQSMIFMLPSSSCADKCGNDPGCPHRKCPAGLEAVLSLPVKGRSMSSSLSSPVDLFLSIYWL